MIIGAATRAACLILAALALSSSLRVRAAQPGHTPAPVLYVAGLAALVCAFTLIVPRSAEAVETLSNRRRRRPAALLQGAALVISPALLSRVYAVLMTGPHLRVGSSGTEEIRFGGVNLSPLIYIVAIPVVEELYFRGLLHREFRAIFGRPALYILANAVWFASIHEGVSLPVAFVVGLFCACLRTSTGGLLLPIVAHMLTNLTLDLPVDGT